MKKIIIDTDTASDDAVALVMALREPALKVVAITTVMGNVSVKKATRNALMCVEYAGVTFLLFIRAWPNPCSASITTPRSSMEMTEWAILDICRNRP